MARYRITGPDGATYEINAPDGATEQDVLSYAQTEFGKAASQAPDMAQRPQPTATAAPVQPERAPYSNAGEAAIGAGKALGTGLFKGLVGLGTLPGNLESLGRAGINSAAGLVGIEPPLSPETLNPVTYRNLMDRLENRFGKTYEPQTTAEKYIQAIGEFAPGGGLAGGISKGARAAQIVAPAVASETAGQLTDGSSYEPYARVAGALAGGSVANLGARTVTPAGAVDTVRARNVGELQRQGVDSLLAGQRTGHKMTRALEDASVSMPGGGRTAGIQDKALEQFTASALKKIGVDDSVYQQMGLSGARATDEVLEFAADQIGKRFENVAKAARVVPDQGFRTRLNNVMKEYVNGTSQATRVPKVQNYVQEIAAEAAKSGGMSGQKYLAIRSALRKDQRGGDDALRDAAGRLVEHLDAQMIRSAPKKLRPQVAKYIQDNNRQWRDYLAISATMKRQGEVSSAGLISPQALNSEIKKQSRNLASRNNREIGKLARAGDDVLRGLKSSGTAERTQAQNVLKSPATFASGAGGAILSGGDPLTMLASAAAPLAIQAATARGVSHPWMQKYLANQMMTGRVNPEASRSVGFGMAPYLMQEYGEQ